jgi:hypothetical protein
VEVAPDYRADRRPDLQSDVLCGVGFLPLIAGEDHAASAVVGFGMANRPALPIRNYCLA